MSLLTFFPQLHPQYKQLPTSPAWKKNETTALDSFWEEQLSLLSLKNDNVRNERGLEVNRNISSFRGIPLPLSIDYTPANVH